MILPYGYKLKIQNNCIWIRMDYERDLLSECWRWAELPFVIITNENSHIIRLPIILFLAIEAQGRSD